MSLQKNTKFCSALLLLAAIVCVGSIIISIMGVRGEWLDIRGAFTAISYATQSSFVVLAAAIVVLILSRGARSAQIKSALALLLVLIPVVAHYVNQPEKLAPGAALNDISTDTINPPPFNAVVPLRPEKSNTIIYPGEAAAARQAALFPDIKSIESSLSVEDAFRQAQHIAINNGWLIAAEDIETGIIEAVASTPVFSFEDDIVIRISTGATGSVIDIRSHSRIGRGDRGKNAQRVREFIKQFN